MLKIEGLDHQLFNPASTSPETENYVTQLEATLANIPLPYTQNIQTLREAAASGQSLFGPIVQSRLATDRSIAGPAGKVRLRVFTPASVRGIYLHFHGGGWALGGANLQDKRLEEIALACEVAVVSVDYRLAPENPYPAAPDDGEAAAVWLAQKAMSEFGSNELVIGGESAGAHLASVTLLRLRDRHGFLGYKGANLLYGAYDLTMTPSAKLWGDRYLVLNTSLVNWYLDMFVPPEKRKEPDVSPLHADLGGLPPALFTIGTLDPMLDDTLFMYCRWLAAGSQAQIAVYPGAPHAFPLMPMEIARQANERCYQFIRQSIGSG
jgi:acetyl esterase/lipase